MNSRLCAHTGAIDLIATLIARKVQFAVVPMGEEFQVSWPDVQAQPARAVPMEHGEPPTGPRAA